MQLDDLIDELASFTPTTLPVVSLFLDGRPACAEPHSGRRAGRRVAVREEGHRRARGTIVIERYKERRKAS